MLCSDHPLLARYRAEHKCDDLLPGGDDLLGLDDEIER